VIIIIGDCRVRVPAIIDGFAKKERGLVLKHALLSQELMMIIIMTDNYTTIIAPINNFIILSIIHCSAK